MYLSALPICVHAYHECHVSQGASDPLKQEVQIFESHQVGDGNQTWSTEKTASVLNQQAICPASRNIV